MGRHKNIDYVLRGLKRFDYAFDHVKEIKVQLMERGATKELASQIFLAIIDSAENHKDHGEWQKARSHFKELCAKMPQSPFKNFNDLEQLGERLEKESWSQIR